MKTLIKIGEEDLILLTKTKGDKNWTQQNDLEIYGQIALPHWHSLWPTKKIQVTSSPPQGRNYNNKQDKVHNISTDSETSSQDNKKQKIDENKATPEAQESNDIIARAKEALDFSTVKSIFDNKGKAMESK